MSDKTNFQKLREFHETFEMDIRDTPYNELFDDHKLLNLRMKLIKEEWDELNEAVENKDMIETWDAITDMLYVLYGMGVSIGIDLDKTFDLVHKSNMSKLCDTEEHAKETVELYKQTKPQFKPSYRKTKDNKKWLVFDELTGKVLKNKYYNAVDLSVFLDKN